MHTISIFVDKNRMPKPASYFECQTHLAKNLRNAANFIIRNLRTGLKKTPDTRTANENEVLETVRIGIEMAKEKMQSIGFPGNESHVDNTSQRTVRF